jgi:hypothetical protein
LRLAGPAAGGMISMPVSGARRSVGRACTEQILCGGVELPVERPLQYLSIIPVAAALRNLVGVKLVPEIVVITVLFAVPVAIVGVAFVWAARKDGEADARLGR